MLFVFHLYIILLCLPIFLIKIPNCSIPIRSLQDATDHIAVAAGALNLSQPMDTVFVKEVRPYGPANLAGLKTGDRLLSVNGMPVAGTPYNLVVAAIQQAPTTLTLQVVPKECDILQTVIDKIPCQTMHILDSTFIIHIFLLLVLQFFSETAHNPETNRRPKQPYQTAQALTPSDIGSTTTIKSSVSSATGIGSSSSVSQQQQQQQPISTQHRNQLPLSGREQSYGLRTKEAFLNGSSTNR